MTWFKREREGNIARGCPVVCCFYLPAAAAMVGVDLSPCLVVCCCWAWLSVVVAVVATLGDIEAKMAGSKFGENKAIEKKAGSKNWAKIYGGKQLTLAFVDGDAFIRKDSFALHSIAS